MVADMSFSEVRLFGDIVARLECQKDDSDVRNTVLDDIATLLRAEYACSYVWDKENNRFDDAYNRNISDKAIENYKSWYQFHDPITFKMRDLGCSIASEVMPYKEFYKTDYYNDVMKKDGLRYGINLYMFDDGRDIGDLRIWRGASASDFEERDKNILMLLHPYLKRSILRYEEFSLKNSGLTDREKDVALLVSKGLTDRDIANYLGIGFSTVRTHLNKSLDKLDCANRAELAARFARRYA